MLNRRSIVVLFTVALSCGFSPVVAGDTSRKRTKPASPWKNVTVIGASLSAGYGTQGEVGKSRVRLSEVLKHMMRDVKVNDRSETMFFLDAKDKGMQAVEGAAMDKADCVVAADFLFWYAYGEHANALARAQSVGVGLKALESLKCPVVLGLLPNMKDAVGRMLRPAMVPDQPTLDALNKTILGWAKKRKNVRILGMVEQFDRIKAGKPTKIGETQLEKGSYERLLQSDKLHPSVEGLAVVGALVVGALEKVKPFPPKTTRTDAKKVLKRLAAARSERETRSEREKSETAGN